MTVHPFLKQEEKVRFVTPSSKKKGGKAFFPKGEKERFFPEGEEESNADNERRRLHGDVVLPLPSLFVIFCSNNRQK